VAGSIIGSRLGGEMGCGARQWQLFSISVGLCGHVDNLLGVGCDLRRMPDIEVLFLQVAKGR
jgi:hypothetical protein